MIERRREMKHAIQFVISTRERGEADEKLKSRRFRFTIIFLALSAVSRSALSIAVTLFVLSLMVSVPTL